MPRGVTFDDYGVSMTLKNIHTISQAIVMTDHVLHPGSQNQQTYTCIHHHFDLKIVYMLFGQRVL